MTTVLTVTISAGSAQQGSNQMAERNFCVRMLEKATNLVGNGTNFGSGGFVGSDNNPADNICSMSWGTGASFNP